MTNQSDFDAMANEMMPILMRFSDVFHEWTLEYPGFIALRTDEGALWTIGTSNGTWGADFYIAETCYMDGDSPDRSIDSGIGADSMDAHTIASALFAAMSADED